MSLDKIYMATIDETACVRFLMDNSVISAPCCRCGKTMNLIRTGYSDSKNSSEPAKATKRLSWRCPTDRKKLSIRTAMLFSGSRIPLRKLIHIAWFWSFGMSVAKTVDMLGVGERSVIVWFGNFRRMCGSWLSCNPGRFVGGQGVDVQLVLIELSKGRCSKATRKPGEEEQRWVFGGWCPSQKKGFLKLLKDDIGPEKILPIVSNHVAVGSTVQSHDWADRLNLRLDDLFVHKVLKNAGASFTNSQSGATEVSGVALLWQALKRKFDAMRGVSGSTMASHIDEFMWRKENGNGEEALYRMLKLLRDDTPRFEPTPRGQRAPRTGSAEPDSEENRGDGTVVHAGHQGFSLSVFSVDNLSGAAVPV